MTKQSKQDWLVIVQIMGGGSWARGDDRAKTIERLKRIVRQDWKSLFKFPKGTKLKANVLDVAGYGEVWWDDFGIWTGTDDDKQPFPKERVEYVELTF